MSRDQHGEKNGNWKGGQTKSQKGYVYLQRPGHPRAMKNGYVKRADLVLEVIIGRPLVRGEEAHHKNHIRDDDSPDNLELHTRQTHAQLHGAEKRKFGPVKPPPRRINWPPMEELRRRLTTESFRAVASDIGCSHVTLFLKMKK